MKKILSVFYILFSVVTLNAQTLISTSNELLLPQYAVNGGVSASRLQYVCRLQLTGLTANATYKYIPSASTIDTFTLSTGAGNFFCINNTANSYGNIVGYTSSPKISSKATLLDSNKFSSLNKYAQFTTDASGNYAGWFSILPTSNGIFNSGKNIYLYIHINDGAGGTSITQSYRTTSTIQMISPDTTATAIYGTSNAAAEQFIFLYDETGNTSRPLYGTWTEDDGITTTFTKWYGSVEAVTGLWGAYIPNSLANGVRRIELRDVDNNIVAYNTDEDGVWSSGANTVNPTGGTTTPIVITSTDASLPVEENTINTVSKFSLSQNYPNPFNPSTVINYQLPKEGHVTLKVYDIIGKEVATLVNETKEAGSYQITFNASKLSSGIYFYSLSAGSFLSVKKMMVLK
jgi:hypothetical protein